jgi:phosphohistidine phosphatase SixA
MKENCRMHRTAAGALAALVVCASLLVPVTWEASATEAAWARAMNGGHTLVMRHAPAVSDRDPANFDIDDCATQSPLSQEGLTQARRQATRFAVRNVPISAVYTSQYCRAQEHAELTFGSAEIVPVPELNRLGAQGENAEDQLAAMIERINGFTGPGNQVFITHGENVEALTGSPSREGEVILLDAAAEPGGMPQVVGRILLN